MVSPPPPVMCEKEFLLMTCSDHIKLSSITKDLPCGAARLLLAVIYSCPSHHTGTGARGAQEWKGLSSPTKPNSAGNTNTVCTNIRDPSLLLQEMEPSSAGVQRLPPLALMTSEMTSICLPSGLVDKFLKNHINQQS